MSYIGQLYQQTYNILCGSHPYYRPWHFQWLFLRDVHKWQFDRIKHLQGLILDVGCGSRSYEQWINQAEYNQYIGIDLSGNQNADVHISADGKWPFADNSIDAILFTQVLEHVRQPMVIIDEITRVLKPNGLVIITVPFMYPAHGLPHDYRRYTLNGIAETIEHNLEIKEAATCGTAGTTIGTMLLTWIENATNSTLTGRILKGVLMPFWILVSLSINLVALFIDRIDPVNTHYSNVCVVAVKKPKVLI